MKALDKVSVYSEREQLNLVGDSDGQISSLLHSVSFGKRELEEELRPSLQTASADTTVSLGGGWAKNCSSILYSQHGKEVGKVRKTQFEHCTSCDH